MSRPLLLSAFAMACVGHQSAGLWTRPEDRSTHYTELDHWISLARLLDDAGFHALFLADVLGTYDVYGGTRDEAVRSALQVPVNDPILAISAMAAATRNLGFGVTVSTTYEQPYALARRMTTLDHLTRGRIGWNVVTGYLDSAAKNLGFTAQIPHDQRYDIADEYLEVCYKLWEHSWTDAAVVADRATGVYARPDQVRDIDHHGEYFTVPGAFLCEPSPQRTPVIFQAGSSPRGRRFAGRHAEAVFVIGPTPAAVRSTVAAVRAEAEAAGRDPRSVRIIAGLTAVVRATDEEAEEALSEYRHSASESGALALFGGWTGVDLAGIPPDAPLVHVSTDANRSALDAFTRDADHEWTVGELARFVSIGGRGPVLAGSAATVADQLQRWQDEADVDGFNFMYVTMPATFADIAEHLVPELRRRGLLDDPVRGPSTLRERLGTSDGPRLPKSHYARRIGIGAPAR
ncbi:Monooxygenase OS=Tsukamurella paurometabola (strain ATCC 8368 / DSM / CCUG 35730 / CIP 100753/ JCM 10117 / KCTC 9821 / NBRC 16120 / NCIMB 702349 / NCTC 13040) OX=521096 GN=Tpau_3997 PE=3 SV=1 [Tsukamurella paurometabola]|uniref:Monooxygenase n=1 Tax=Tsukamurella paurometabola (strain ATCC 8368 / DSM 20162 / CCUG 35730 / CIP 100753 / JCM 10117 / KCTC 9821 / NBRC 16120 / NCIMB 702349 / NCTC 13040) TaxID=521096 RepID=D5UN73_TSUPD|nr:LLM class flavin-dependent oxidoreductase [Tsukamurella paurometabola]ADG80568.1 monooxygenase [Tsukamurella paurometabola DSM 20162]SUP40124.1 Pristinamycin IIA synthase subunit A [Tsukamurella paurometabola]